MKRSPRMQNSPTRKQLDSGQTPLHKALHTDASEVRSLGKEFP
jgi:hypothetical protein